MGFNPFEDLAPSDKGQDKPQERQEGNVAADIFEDMKGACTQAARDIGGTAATEMPDWNTGDMWAAYDEPCPSAGANAAETGLEAVLDNAAEELTGSHERHSEDLGHQLEAGERAKEAIQELGDQQGASSNVIELNWDVEHAPDISELAVTPSSAGDLPLPYPNVARAQQDTNQFMKDVLSKLENTQDKITGV